MKLEDLYLINKEEWLDVIKDKCKKQVQEKSEDSFLGWVGSLDTFPDNGDNCNIC